jgi:hypothetical protein
VSVRRVWRISATWNGARDTRHYLTRRAAEARAELWRKGREGEGAGDGDWMVPPLAAADPGSITVERSDPVTWPDP